MEDDGDGDSCLSWLKSFSHDDGLTEMDAFFPLPELAAQPIEGLDHDGVVRTLDISPVATDETCNAPSDILLATGDGFDSVVDDTAQSDEDAAFSDSDAMGPAETHVLPEESAGNAEASSASPNASKCNLLGHLQYPGFSLHARSKRYETRDDSSTSARRSQLESASDGIQSPFPPNPYTAHQTQATTSNQADQQGASDLEQRDGPGTPSTSSLLAGVGPLSSGNKSHLQDEMRLEEHNAASSVNSSPIHTGGVLFRRRDAADGDPAQNSEGLEGSIDIKPSLKRVRAPSTPSTAPKQPSKRQKRIPPPPWLNRHTRPVFTGSSNRTQAKSVPSIKLLPTYTSGPEEDINDAHKHGSATKADSPREGYNSGWAISSEGLGQTETPSRASKGRKYGSPYATARQMSKKPCDLKTLVGDIFEADDPVAKLGQPRTSVRNTRGTSTTRDAKEIVAPAHANENLSMKQRASPHQNPGATLPDQRKRLKKATRKKGLKAERIPPWPSKEVSDLHALVDNKVMGNVSSVPRQTRNQRKKDEESRPDAAGAAKRRHTLGSNTGRQGPFG